MKRHFIMAGCFVLTAFLCVACKKSGSIMLYNENQEIDVSEVQAEQNSKEALVDDSKELNADSEKEQPDSSKNYNDIIYVQVNGAVLNPGVYEMQEGQRIFEAVEKAGGMTNEAAKEAVNQSVVLEDGQMVTIPTSLEWEKQMETEKAEQDSLEESDGLININTADLETLCSIPGIGRTRAQDIITYRSEKGAFSCIEDIKKVSGIKDGLFNKIKDKIKV